MTKLVSKREFYKVSIFKGSGYPYLSSMFGRKRISRMNKRSSHWFVILSVIVVASIILASFLVEYIKINFKRDFSIRGHKDVVLRQNRQGERLSDVATWKKNIRVQFQQIIKPNEPKTSRSSSLEKTTTLKPGLNSDQSKMNYSATLNQQEGKKDPVLTSTKDKHLSHATAKASSMNVLVKDKDISPTQPTHAKNEVTVQVSKNEKTNANTRKEKVVLLYTTLFNKERWTDLSDKQIVDYPQRAKCKHAETCKLTYDKNTIDYADAVIFHGVDLMNEERYSLTKLQDSIKRRPQYQRWVFFMHESPENYNKFQSYKNLFNWTMSYEYRSDIFVPYNHFQPLSDKERQLVSDRNYAEGKKKLAIWMVSDCGRLRDKYMKALQKRISVSIYGQCASQFISSPGSCKKDSQECLNIVKEHKFYFAFENSMCRDYITEKFWLTLTHYEAIPVVWGANYDDKIVPPGSYIDTEKFSSVKALADYLLYLDKNDTAYNEYFKWKRKYRIGNYDKICQVCEAIHRENAPTRIYEDIWSVNRSCKEYDAKKDRLRKIIQEAGIIK